jgi:SpoVK/Ycf46/Vps4 family AAA+-type ATPase
MLEIDMGRDYAYAFDPVKVDNDQPLEVDAQASNLVKEIDTFLKKGDVFKKFGFSHKRGYLLHGPPGCGKSSTLRLLQKHFIEKFDGIVLIWRKNDFSNHLERLRDFEPGRAVMVVCEDIDGILVHFEKSMLEVLDGQKGLNNFVLVATTNYLDKIPSRIKDRPSRIDRVVEMGLPDTKVRLKYLKSIGLEHAQAERLAFKSDGLSIAKLKELVIATVCFDEPVEDVVKRLMNADMTVSNDDDDDD